MNPKRLKDILADQEQIAASDHLELSPEDREALASLLDVANRVQSTVRPVSPPKQFEEELKQELLSIAQSRRTAGYTPPNPARDLLILLSLIGLIVAALGLLLSRRLLTNR